MPLITQGKTNWKYILILLLVVLALVFCSTVLFFYFQQKQNISQTLERLKASPREAIDTSDWKIYQSEECGFFIKYPSNWSFAERNSEDCVPAVEFYNEDFPLVGWGARTASVSISRSQIYNFPLVSPLLTQNFVRKTGEREEDIIVGDSYIGKFGESPGVFIVTLSFGKYIYYIQMMPLFWYNEQRERQEFSPEERQEIEETFMGFVKEFELIK